MRNVAAIGVGLAFIIVALFLSLGQTNQDNVQRPPDALAFATALHTTPTPTLTDTPVPPPTATSWPLLSARPGAEEAVRFLFQQPYQGLYLLSCCARVSFGTLTDPDGGEYGLVLAGDGAVLTDGTQNYPVAFGAVLLWENGKYVLKYRVVQSGRENPLVSLSLQSGGQAVLRFRNLGWGRDPGAPYRLDIYLKPCGQTGGGTPTANPEEQGVDRAYCY